MNTIQFTKDKIPFTMVANDVLTDSRLSAKAKGIYAYLYSKPDGWDFAVKRIQEDMSDGEDSIEKGIHELEAFGFLTRHRQPTGRVLYTVHFPPIKPFAENRHKAQKPFAEKPKQGKTQTGKIGNISNKEGAKKQREVQTNKELAETSSAGGKSIENIQIDEIIKAFSEFNNACSKMYGVPPQRKACEQLIDSQTYERVIKIVALLPQTNTMTYAPNISTPHELWMKWSKLEDFLKKERQKQIDRKNKLNPQVNIVNGIPVKVMV